MVHLRELGHQGAAGCAGLKSKDLSGDAGKMTPTA
jgi:hypothetical protein